MIILSLCKARERKRSIVDLCEHFTLRWLVQKELIRTIFKLKMGEEILCQTKKRVPDETRLTITLKIVND